ncbi:phosphodiester glycosidase family protein [Bhargavaea ullalensis]|uniref:SLH domain-containing protein n=1 Tax=Bhargavaea ullalensis TaxID=1265685 RepID=A0ABV2GAT5_9BACL
MKSMKATAAATFASIILLSSAAVPAQARTFTVTPGVEYDSETGQKPGANRLTIDMQKPGVSVEALTNDPIDSLLQTSVLSKKLSIEGHQIVGSINGSIFHINPKYNPLNKGMPAYLLMQDGEVNTYGAIEKDRDQFMNRPSAFAVTKEGKGHIGLFGYDAEVSVNGIPTTIDSINKQQREENEIILYTDTFSYRDTHQNKYGMEIVLNGFSKPFEEGYKLGDQVQATVASVGPGGYTAIPEGGAVLSIHGPENVQRFSGLKKGEQVSLKINLTKPWNDAKFVLASGPLLVQNGKVKLEMDPKSARANEIAPRTAVATNADGSEVYLITVDGRSSVSRGMKLPEFAQYLVSIGAYNALNLDGGGSTTMAVRERGAQYPVVFNRLSDGAERRVSTILSAVSYEATGTPVFLDAKISSSSVAKGGRAKVSVNWATDRNYHPVKVDAAKLQYSVEGNIGTISANGDFTASNTGKGTVTVRYGNASKSFPVEVLKAEPNGMVTGFERAADWKAESVRAKTALRFDGPKSPVKEGKTSLGLQYDFTGQKGTSASYAVTNSINLASKPERLGLWVFGDEAKHWLRGTIKDGAGKEYTIDFTEQGGLDWDGWRYVTANLPAGAVSPISVQKFYVAEPLDNNKNKGTIYLDRLIADYDGRHVEQPFNDIPLDFWHINEIRMAVENGWINGYPDGTYRPADHITRAHAALLISRTLGRKGSVVNEDPFKDVSKDYGYAGEIALMKELGIMTGDENGNFKPQAKLSRAQMAKVLQQTYKLQPKNPVPEISDIDKNNWSYGPISTIASHGLTVLGENNTYRPNSFVSRTQFAAFIARAESMEK